MIIQEGHRCGQIRKGGMGMAEVWGSLRESSGSIPNTAHPPSSSPPLSPTSLIPCWPPWNFQRMTYVSEPPLWFPLLTLPSPQFLVIFAYQIRPVSAIRVFSGPLHPHVPLLYGAPRESPQQALLTLSLSLQVERPPPAP